jgi:hypothetical protein
MHGVLRAMLGGDLTGGGAGGFTAFFAALRADCRDCSASWPSRAARARASKRIAKTGLSRGPETYRRNGGGPSRQGRLWAVATAVNSPHHPTQERRFVRPAPTLWRARPARQVLRSSVQVPCDHSCEAIAPVRLISVHRRRNLNGDSLMHTVDRGREWPYFDVSHCSTLQSGGSAVRPARRAAERYGFVSRAAFACRQREATINKRPLSRWGWGKARGLGSD